MGGLLLGGNVYTGETEIFLVEKMQCLDSVKQVCSFYTKTIKNWRCIERLELGGRYAAT
jgi:hypothetical protein